MPTQSHSLPQHTADQQIHTCSEIHINMHRNETIAPLVREAESSVPHEEHSSGEHLYVVGIFGRRGHPTLKASRLLRQSSQVVHSDTAVPTTSGLQQNKQTVSTATTIQGNITSVWFSLFTAIDQMLFPLCPLKLAKLLPL